MEGENAHEKHDLHPPRRTVSAAALIFIPASEALAEEFRASDNCIDIITKYEPCRLTAYKDLAGIRMIGYGHTKGVASGDTLADEAEARELLRQDLAAYENAVNARITNRFIRFEVARNRFDAPVSFAECCGVGNPEKLVKGRTAEEVAKQSLTCDKGGNKILPIRVERRNAERELFPK